MDFDDIFPAAAKAVEDLLGSLDEKTPKLDRSTLTGVFGLDLLMGGGLPAGTVEVFGLPSSGKTTFLYTVMKTAQGLGYKTGLVSGELPNPYLMDIVGVDGDLVASFPWDPEGVVDLASDFLAEENSVLFVENMHAVIGEDYYTRGAWLWDICEAVGPGSCMLFTSQVRATGKNFKDTRSQASGYDGVVDGRINLVRESDHKDGFKLLAQVQKSRVCKAAQWITLNYIKGRGIDIEADILNTARELGVITTKGPHWYLGEERIGQGEAQVKARISELYRPLLDKTLELFKNA